MTQCGRSPRRTAPQKRPRQDSAAVGCVHVRTEKVRSQSEVVREEGKSTLEEVRVVVCEEGTAGAIENTEKERRVVTVEERAGVEKETGDSTAGTTAICDICRVPQRLLRMHLPCCCFSGQRTVVGNISGQSVAPYIWRKGPGNGMKIKESSRTRDWQPGVSLLRPFWCF